MANKLRLRAVAKKSGIIKYYHHGKYIGYSEDCKKGRVYLSQTLKSFLYFNNIKAPSKPL